MMKLLQFFQRYILCAFVVSLVLIGCSQKRVGSENVSTETPQVETLTEAANSQTLPPTSTPTHFVPTSTPPPTETATLPNDYYESEGLGIRVVVPADWSIKESTGWVQLGVDEISTDLGISPNPETLQGGQPFAGDFNESALVLFLGDLWNEGEGTQDAPIDLLYFSLAWYVMGEFLENGEFITEPESIVINGVEAAVASVRAPGPPDNQEVTWVWAVVKKHWSEVIWVIGLDNTEDGRYHEEILQVIDSIEFIQSNQDEITQKYESSALGIDIEIPTGWVFEESPESLEIGAYSLDDFYDGSIISIFKAISDEEASPQGGEEEALDIGSALLEIIDMNSEEYVLIQEPTELNINGNQAGFTVVRDNEYFNQDSGATFVYAIIKKDNDEFLFVFGRDGTIEGRYTDLILETINTINFLPSP